MTTDPQLWLRRRRCSAVQVLQRTVRTMRQHADTPRLRDSAVDRCCKELAALLAEAELVMQLHNGEVHCGDQPVLAFGPADLPFGLLAEQGIGEVAIDEGTDAATIGRLLELWAAATGNDPGRDLGTEVHRANLDGVHLRAPRREPRLRRSTGQPIDWWLFPEPRPDPVLQPLLEREVSANLPLLTARMLLADLEHAAASTATTTMTAEPPEPLVQAKPLTGLCSAMLDNGDAASVTWLLEQAQHHVGVTNEQAFALRGVARRAFDSDWLAGQLEQGERVGDLVALAMELGDEYLERLATVAVNSGVPLPSWVTSMLPPGE